MNNRRRSNGVSSPPRQNGEDFDKPLLNGKHSHASPQPRPSIRSSLWMSSNNSAGRSKLSLMLSLGFATALFALYLYDRTRRHYIPAEPPSSMIFRGKRSSYQKVPPQFKHTFHIPDGTKFRRTVARAFRYNGFRTTDEPDNAQFIIDKGEDPWRYPRLKAWQRYNNIPGTKQWESKDRFIKGFQQYQEMNPGTKFEYLPETYRLSTDEGFDAFQKRLFQNGGINFPWVLKNPDVNNGKGVEMLGPRSHELKTVLDRVERESDENDYIIQEYVCNELTWWRNKKFDLRFYWAVASVDPLIVLYHDGYVRVGNAVYNETEFNGPRTQHLTTHTYLSAEDKGTIEELEERIRYHYQQNRRKLKKRIKIDPFHHVRNQFKEALAQTVVAFRDLTFGGGPHHENYKFENCWNLNGADFVLDNDLDVWYIEAQEAPGLEEEFDFRVEMHRDLYRPLIRTVAEIQDKLEKDPTASVLPLENLGKWEIIYAGSGVDQWAFEYKGYERAKNKPTCTIPPSKKTK